VYLFLKNLFRIDKNNMHERYALYAAHLRYLPRFSCASEYWNECVFGSILLTTGRHIATSNVSDYRNILRVTHVVNTHVVRVYTATIKVHNASFEWRVYEQFSDISAFAFGAADATENALSSWCRVRWAHICAHACTGRSQPIALIFKAPIFET